MDLSLTGKVAIVTGSSRGLGLASAAALLREGCRVTICARGEARLKEAAAELNGWRRRCLPIVADVSTAEGVESVVSRTVEAFGGLDILVNNVGLARGAGIADTSRRRVDRSVRSDAVSGDPGFPAGGSASAPPRRRGDRHDRVDLGPGIRRAG